MKTEFVIVTGISGAGKSCAVNVMEDIGYFCIDNMPPQLIPKFAEICEENEDISKVAIVTDIRGGTLFLHLSETIDELKARGLDTKLMFVDANHHEIKQRYKETRRRHPLADQTDSLQEAVCREREMMQPVRERADYVIDTSRTSTAQLRGELLQLFGDGVGKKAGMTVSVTSFGYKYGLPLEADLVIDVRFMPNPFYIEELRPQTGLDKAVSDYVFSFQQTKDFLKRLEELLAFTLPLYAEEGKTSLVIAVGCTGGHHRSVAVTHALAEFIAGQGYQVAENHRDMTRGG